MLVMNAGKNLRHVIVEDVDRIHDVGSGRSVLLSLAIEGEDMSSAAG